MAALSGVYGPISTLIYVPGILQMTRDLDVSIEAINTTISAYVALAGLIVSAPLSNVWLALQNINICNY